MADAYPTGSACTHVRACGRTDLGRERQNNEDAFLVADVFGTRPTSDELSVPLNRGGAVVLAVSDGMGGEKAGEVASALTLEALGGALARLLPKAGPDVALRTSFEYANRVVTSESQKRGREGMGATLTAALISGAHVVLSTVGDSRAYLLRCGRLIQLTRDQSYAQMLVDGGMLHREDVEKFPMRNVILQAMGRAPRLSFTISDLELRRDDQLLLCSDGLSGEVKDEEIAAVLAEAQEPSAACKALVDAANAHGGRDNITVVLATVNGELLPLPAPDEPIVGTFANVVSAEG
jgi:protein phosphatase